MLIRNLTLPLINLPHKHVPLRHRYSVVSKFWNLRASSLSSSSISTQKTPNLIHSPGGTIVFTTVGRQNYGFDVFSVKLPSNLNTSNLSNSDEHRLTDGISLNFNAQFTSHQNQSIVYISERNGLPTVFLTRPDLPKPQELPFAPESLFHDRPIIKNNRLYFISAHEKPDQLFKSWNALYVTDLNNDHNGVTRLTPNSAVDFSPAVSLSGNYIAVASYGSRPWDGEFQDLYTDIVVFKESESDKRVVICERGGWPSWSGDTTVYFHRKADDGWWSIFQVKLPENMDDFSGFPIAPVRITPPGVHCFTPAAMHNTERIVVATRRRGKDQRHIEIFDVASNTFYPVTELVNPSFHHYNPFVSPDSMYIGYHRFRGESASGQTSIPNIEPVISPENDLHMLRINGSFPSFSPDGDFIAFNAGVSQGLHIVKSDGSKRWTLLPRDRVAFHTSWSPTEKNVIYTTLGPGFAPVDKTVQIARVIFDPSDLKSGLDQIPCEVKMLTGEDSGNNAFSSCSPDGKSIVFRSGRNGHKNLYIIDAVEGEFNGNVRQITEGPWIDTMPSWSPKGDLIAFSSNRHNPGHANPFSIYVVKPDGSDLKRIRLEGTEKLSEDERERIERINHVCFSGDGEWLLFTANLGSLSAEPVSLPRQMQPYGDLYVAKLDGSGLRRLTWNGFENGTPAWYYPGSEQYDVGDRPLMVSHRSALVTKSLSVEQDAGDKLTGQFNDPPWLTIE
ncbi:uncharacterized protein LOC126686473 [Mercurialis annua]|uniref:uncharacterized protein LOC126686473 n=1 Tax=Mercurialis annua TaxID=3986 RepID=UPI00215FA612|nr:uncharacterized protein LOC126686473 [Mercurialis annua]